MEAKSAKHMSGNFCFFGEKKEIFKKETNARFSESTRVKVAILLFLRKEILDILKTVKL